MHRLLLRSTFAVVLSLAVAPLALAGPTMYNFLSVSSPGDPAFTQLLGINNSSTIAGYFGDGSVVPNNGFTLVLPGSYTPENFPGAAQTQVIGINGAGDTDGFYITGGVTHGFTFIGGSFATVDFANPPSVLTQLLGLNNSNEAAGYWQDAAGNQFAFTWKSGTGFTGLNSLLPPTMMAQATGVNNAGLVSGFFVDGTGTHGFLLNGTTETTLNAPLANGFTQALGLNNRGQIVGTYTDAGGAMHGFVYAGGVFTTVDDPSGVGTTIVNGINDLGQLVGFYVSGGNTIGFVATPTPEPASLLLMGSGLLASLGVLRCKLRG